MVCAFKNRKGESNTCVKVLREVDIENYRPAHTIPQHISPYIQEETHCTLAQYIC